MAVALRLTRLGAKKKPFYRIVATDSRKRRDGAHLEILGHYDPKTEPATVKLDNECVSYWLSVGAQPSETVAGLIKRYRAANPEAPAQNG